MATVRDFFDACETGKGWAVCEQYCTADATFEAQSEHQPLVDIKTLKDYTNWMADLASKGTPGCSYDLHHWGHDAERHSYAAFATFHGTHSGDWPCPATGKSTASHYVYVMRYNEDGKITGMTKIWNAPWAMKEFGWA